ncbi:uncharacterized protein LOC128337699 [Hemicordylus capensis]|uniref:uncharacterized protein LOC128337699 n=1 Tax=Hemicordylus capensis TaxID=884348 RepID=UPI0023020409|nr:uncharacterized protein LOC128337699 [Hemicordylus capensis]XP_053134953.1 uncharacterized protein LOC128337699 [Hemicordylus capensis]
MAVYLQPSTDGSCPASYFLQKLHNLVESINPEGSQDKQRASNQRPRIRSPAFTQHAAKVQTDVVSPCSEGTSRTGKSESELLPEASPTTCTSLLQDGRTKKRSSLLPPPPADAHLESMVVPRISLEVCRNELDEQLEAIEQETDALVAYWNSSSWTEDVDETSRISKWCQSHPLDLNDDYIHEDPNYDEAQVEREALQDYVAGLGEREVAVAERLPERLPSPANGLAKMCPDRLAILKKPFVALRRVDVARRAEEEAQEELASASDINSSSDDEATGLLRKRPKRDAVGRQTARLKNQALRSSRNKGGHRSKLSQKDFAEGKAPRHHPSVHRQPGMGPPSRSSRASPASSEKRTASKTYNFRSQSKIVRYASEEEEEEEEDGDSEDRWSPDGIDTSDGEEGEEAEGVAMEEAPASRTAQGGRSKKAARCYPCPECGREFSNSSNMRKHLRIHKGELPFGCHVCGKAYSDPSNLARHQMAHTGERPHQCPTCPKAFYLKHQLSAHLRHHEGIRPFSCLGCESSFCSRAELAAHIKSHAEGHRPQPQRCEDCDKTYSSHKQLRRHQRRHGHFACEECGETFTLKFKYFYHKTLHLGPCKRCGAVGAHFCEGGVAASQGFGSAAVREESARGPPNAAADGPSSDAGASPGRLPERSDATQARIRPPGSDRPSAEGSLRYPREGETQKQTSSAIQARTLAILETLVLPAPTAGAPTMILGPARAKRSAGISLDPVLFTLPPPAGDNPPPSMTTVITTTVTGPSAPTVSVFQQLPAGTLLQNGPVPCPVNSVHTVARPVDTAQSGSWPGDPVTLRPVSQASMAFPVPAVAPPILVPLGASDQEPYMVVLNNAGSALPSGSSPVGRAANKDLILLHPGPLPAGTKIIMELPVQKMVPSLMAQICPFCQTEYVGKHHCKLSHTGPARRDEEGPVIIDLEAEEGDLLVPQQPPPVQQAEREAPTKTYNFRKARSQVTYADPGEGDLSDVGEDSEDNWRKEDSSATETLSESEEDEVPLAGSTQRKRLGPPPRREREERPAKRRRDRYMCSVCDKRFVYHRSLKQHMRLHYAFSCKQCGASFLRSEHLNWHMHSHEKGATA